MSETFILNQITGLLDMGHKVEIFALCDSDDKKVHPDVTVEDLKVQTQAFLDGIYIGKQQVSAGVLFIKGECFLCHFYGLLI